MKNFSFIIVLCLSFSFVKTQAQSSELCRLKEVWNTQMGGNNYKESASAMTLTPEGNLVVVGSIHSKIANGKTTDAYIAVLDTKGKMLWSKEIGGSQFDTFVSIDACMDGSFWAIGQTESNDEDLAGVRTIAATNQLWVTKISNSGEVLQNVLIPNVMLPATIKADISGGFVIAAQTINAVNEDIFLGKFDGQGKELWKTVVGGMNKESESQIDVNANGEIALLFASSSDFGFVNKGGNDLVVMKWSADGQNIWQKTFGGSQNEKGNSIQFIADNQLVITARTYSVDGDIVPKMGNQKSGKGWLLKLDDAGKLIWQSYLLGNPVQALSLQDGSFWVLNELSYSLNAALFNNYESLSAYSMACLQKVNKKGGLEWSALMGQPGHLSKATTLQYNLDDESIYVSGNVFPSSSDSQADYWVGKFNYVGHDIAPKLSVFDSQDADWTSKTLDISKKVVPLTAKINVRIGEQASYGWLRDGIIVKGYSAENQSNTIFEKGNYQALITHKGCSMLSDTITIIGQRVAEVTKKDTLIALQTKLNPKNVAIPVSTEDEKLVGYQVFPNPAQDKVYILPLSGVQALIQLQLMREDGKAISKLENIADDSMVELSLAGLPAGSYLLQINADNQKVTTKKVVKL